MLLAPLGHAPSLPPGAHLMYSSLFSSVTRRLAPSGFRSCDVILPRISMSTEKYISRPHSSMSLSLGRHERAGSRSSSGTEEGGRRGVPRRAPT